MPLVRSSNMGFSGLINPLGKIIYQVEKERNSYIDVKIPNSVETIYSKYRLKIVYFLIALLLTSGNFIKYYFIREKYK